jgi:uncharacterized membrane protein
MSNQPFLTNGSKQSTDRIAGNIEAIVRLNAAAEQKVPRHQRFIESITGQLGRPKSLYLMLVFVSLWIGLNVFADRLNIIRFDPPPFYWLQGITSLSALLVTTMVLITQNRQAVVEQQRSHLDIQVNLLSEQKITKLISLVEELRMDLPNVRNRHDPEAQQLSQSTDPASVVEELQKNFDNAERIDDQVTE